jgi:hypothetical protein
VLVFVARALDQLRSITEPPRRECEAATLRWVRQSRRYPLWRVSYAYHPQAAVRLICWFPPGTGTVVVALFAADKAWLGDVFYDGSLLAPTRWWTSGNARQPMRRSHEQPCARHVRPARLRPRV